MALQIGPLPPIYICQRAGATSQIGQSREIREQKIKPPSYRMRRKIRAPAAAWVWRNKWHTRTHAHTLTHTHTHICDVYTSMEVYTNVYTSMVVVLTHTPDAHMRVCSITHTHTHTHTQWLDNKQQPIIQLQVNHYNNNQLKNWSDESRNRQFKCVTAKSQSSTPNLASSFEATQHNWLVCWAGVWVCVSVLKG